jgi:hypothetical protein
MAQWLAVAIPYVFREKTAVVPARNLGRGRPYTQLQGYMIFFGANVGVWLQFAALLQYCVFRFFIFCDFHDLDGYRDERIQFYTLLFYLRRNSAPLGPYRWCKAVLTYWGAILFPPLYALGVIAVGFIVPAEFCLCLYLVFFADWGF